MTERSSPKKYFKFEISEDELRVLKQALNEVCNGVHIDDVEFPTRLGCSREEAGLLMERIKKVLSGA